MYLARCLHSSGTCSHSLFLAGCDCVTVYARIAMHERTVTQQHAVHEKVLHCGNNLNIALQVALIWKTCLALALIIRIVGEEKNQ